MYQYSNCGCKERLREVENESMEKIVIMCLINYLIDVWIKTDGI